MIALVLVTNLLDAARSTTLLPLYADERLGGAQALGFVSGTFGGAAFLGSLLFGYVAHRVPRRITFVLCFVLAGGPSLLVPALGLGLPWMLGASALSGLAAGALNPILGAVELERIPEHMRARVFGLLGAGSYAGIPLGGLLAGLAAEGIGVSTTFGVVVAVYTVVTLAPLTGGAWRLMERRSSGGDPAADDPAEGPGDGETRPGGHDADPGSESCPPERVSARRSREGRARQDQVRATVQPPRSGTMSTTRDSRSSAVTWKRHPAVRSGAWVMAVGRSVGVTVSLVGASDTRQRRPCQTIRTGVPAPTRP